MVSRHPGKGRPSSRSRAPSAQKGTHPGRSFHSVDPEIIQAITLFGPPFHGNSVWGNQSQSDLASREVGHKCGDHPGGTVESHWFSRTESFCEGRPTLTCPNQHLARKSICLRLKVERAKGKDRANPGAERRGRFESSSPEQGQVYTRQDQRLQNRILLARLNVYAHISPLNP